MTPHVHVPAPDDDVLGTASACCPLPAGNAVHIDPADLPPAPHDGRYEVEPDDETSDQ